MTNRPVSFNDPTGHVMTQGDGGGSKSVDCKKYPQYCNGDDPKTGDELRDLRKKTGDETGKDETKNPLIDILDYYNYGLNETMDGCNPFDPNQISAFWNNAACLDVMSNLSQDMATLFSTTGASVTLALTLLACIPASEVGGCGVGYALGFLVYQTFFNPYETIFSGASTFMTIRSDFLTHDTYFNGLRDWQIGEDSKTSFGASLIGGLTPEPFIDAAIDTYSSGYNHGYFCGCQVPNL